MKNDRQFFPRLFLTLFLSFNAYIIPAQELMISQDQRFIVKKDGTPFFYLGDTAWELFHYFETIEKSESGDFSPHSIGRGSDWILVIQDASKRFNDVTNMN